jgi:hypothetical protein
MFCQAKQNWMGAAAKHRIVGHFGNPDIFFHLLNPSRVDNAPYTGSLDLSSEREHLEREWAGVQVRSIDNRRDDLFEAV